MLLGCGGRRGGVWGHSARGTSRGCPGLGRIQPQTPSGAAASRKGTHGAGGGHAAQAVVPAWWGVRPLPAASSPSHCRAGTRIDGKRFERLQMWRLYC